MKSYLVRGDNDVIIHKNYASAERCLPCFRRGIIKRYESFAEAEEAALDHLSDIVPYYARIPNSLRIDQMITVAKLLREQGLEQEGF